MSFSDQNVCDGDSVIISANGFTSYNWSTGDTVNPIYIDTTSQVYVTVANNSGCLANSDTIDVIWRSLPNKPIISVSNDSLIYSTNLNIQWYYNTNLLSGETDTLHIAQNNGDYFVEVTDSFGCKNVSDTVNVMLLGIESTINNKAFIYPNPTNGSINVTLLDKNIESIELYNLLGEELMNIAVNRHETNYQISLDKFAEGTYLLKLKSENQVEVHQLVLLR